MTAQIKLFVSSKREKVEQEVNDFLNENKRKINVEDIKLSVNDHQITILLIYTT